MCRFSHQAVLLTLILVLRKRIGLTVEIFQVTHKAIRSTPFLFWQPLWTFAILMFFWVLWVAVLLSLGTAGKGLDRSDILELFPEAITISVSTTAPVQPKVSDNSDGAGARLVGLGRGPGDEGKEWEIPFPLLYGL